MAGSAPTATATRRCSPLAASIPIALYDAIQEGVIDRPKLVFAPGFGAGAVGGYAVMRVDPAILAKEKEIAAEQVKNKPPQAIAKIVEGKLEKFFQGYCLVDQGFVKKNSEIAVKDHVASVAKQLGDEITIRRFVRFQVGESAPA